MFIAKSPKPVGVLKWEALQRRLPSLDNLWEQNSMSEVSLRISVAVGLRSAI